MQGPALGWALLGTAVALLAVTATLVWRAMHRMRAGGRAHGEIVGSEKAMSESNSDSHSNQTFYRPKVRFAARDGKSHTFVSAVGRGKPYVEGTRVSVAYDPAHPEDAEIAGFARNWLIPLVLAAVGAFSLVMGLGLVTKVENKPGAGGTVGAAQAKRAPPDGYTVLVSSLGPFVAVPASSPHKSVADVIKLLEANPDKMTFASAGKVTAE